MSERADARPLSSALPAEENAALMACLCARLRIDPAEVSVPCSLPVLFFGDALKARVATIGLNPSKSEYLDRGGALLNGKAQRFATTNSLGVVSRAELTDQQADEAIAVMRAYYDDGKPVYGSYFRHLTNLLAGMGVSYSGRSATHLDLVQEATDPVWGDLGSQEKAVLLDRDLPFLIWELENLPRLEAIVCAGKTVSQQLARRVPVAIEDEGRMERIRWWIGRVRVGSQELPIGGFNYPLDRPTGLGTAGEIELGNLFAGAFL